jgi:hypothetical protein
MAEVSAEQTAIYPLVDQAHAAKFKQMTDHYLAAHQSGKKKYAAMMGIPEKDCEGIACQMPEVAAADEARRVFQAEFLSLDRACPTFDASAYLAVRESPCENFII